MLLVKVSDQAIEIDPEARKALNFIQTGRQLNNKTSTAFLLSDVLTLVVRMHTLFFARCRQPIKKSIIRLFSYVCTEKSSPRENLLEKQLFL